MTAAPRPGHQHEPLARTLGIASLVLYGLGTIIGAGIYVLVGEVASEAGAATPLAFVLAGVLASLTGLSYAELVGRNPAAEGSVAFVHHAFGSRLLSLVTGIAFAAVTIVASASITLGGAAYVARWIDLPQPVIGGAVVVVFTAIACLRVTESVRVAALFSAVEVVGLLVVIAVGSPSLSGIGPELAAMIPGSTDGWLGLGAGTFIAFFAYIGFEGMANMAEETADVGRTLPRAILVAIAISGILYGVVSLIAVLAVEPEELAGNPAPLIPVLERYAPQMIGTFAAVAVVATLNGVLIGIVVAARLAYGMARRSHWWAWFGQVNAATRTPIHATAVVGAIVFALVVLVPFQALVSITSALTLGVFAAVNASLWQLKRRDPRPAGVTTIVPPWVPVAGGAACVALMAASALHWLY